MTIRSISAIPPVHAIRDRRPQAAAGGQNPAKWRCCLSGWKMDQGLVGWGEAFGFAVWPATKAAIEALVSPMAVGRDEADIAGLMNDLARKFHLLGRSGPVMYALSVAASNPANFDIIVR